MGRPPTSIQRARGESHRTDIVEYITAWHRDNGYGPSLREIATGVGLGLSATTYHVGQLRGRGVLVSEPRKPRSIRIVEPAPTGVGAATPRPNDSGLSVGAVEMHTREPL